MHEDERERIETDSIRVEEARGVLSLAGRRYDLFVMVEEKGVVRSSFLLAERARSECARSTRAVNDNLAAPLKGGEEN